MSIRKLNHNIKQKQQTKSKKIPNRRTIPNNPIAYKVDTYRRPSNTIATINFARTPLETSKQ